MPTPSDFAKSWVSQNVHNVPGLEDMDRHVAGLRPEFIAAAKAQGITESQLDAAVGDIDDFLTHEYENVHDPELGFRD